MKVRLAVTLALLTLTGSVAKAQTTQRLNSGSMAKAVTITPKLELGADTVTVSGLTPRGTAVIFAVLALPQRHWSGYARRQFVVTDADGDGIVQVKDAYISARSIWTAVDLATGSSVIASPAGYDVRRIDLPGKGVKRGLGGQLDRITAGHEFLEGLVVRPGSGAWEFTAGDGGQHDADGEVNGRIEVDPEKMLPIGASPAAPKHLLPHDTLIIIDPFTMQIFASEEQS